MASTSSTSLLTRVRNGSRPADGGGGHDGAFPEVLTERLDDWERAGLLTHPQAVAITGFEQAREHIVTTLRPPPPPRPVPSGAPAAVRAEPMSPTAHRLPSVAEALGYLGGVLALVGLVLLLSRVWDGLPTPGRVALAGGVSVAFLAAGALVPEAAHPALARLRSFLWFLSTATAGLCAGVIAVDVFDAADDLVTASAVAGTVAVHAGATWAGRPRILQQAPFLAALAVVAGTLSAQITSDAVTGLVVWAVGVTIVEIGLVRLTPLPLVTEVIGALALLIGSMIISTDWHAFGQILATVSAAVLVAIAAYNEVLPTKAERRMLAVIGVFALLQALPSTLVYFGRQAGILTGVATWIGGVVLVLAATHPRVRLSTAVTVLGGFALVGGAALCGVQSVGFATVFGLVSAIALVAIGTLPRWALMSVFGALGLLVNVPWAVNWFFPGEGRAPLLIMVSGAVIIGVALLLTRRGSRIRRELIVR